MTADIQRHGVRTRASVAARGEELVSERARSLLPVPRVPVIRELSWFWPVYLWHHRRPWTRRLHHAGSWACIAGGVLALSAGDPWLVPAGLFAGYLLAFVGHWVVEKNRPLTFGHPVLAGICNWIMFALELSGRLTYHLQVATQESEEEWNDVDVGSE